MERLDGLESVDYLLHLIGADAEARLVLLQKSDGALSGLPSLVRFGHNNTKREHCKEVLAYRVKSVDGLLVEVRVALGLLLLGTYNGQHEDRHLARRMP